MEQEFSAEQRKLIIGEWLDARSDYEFAMDRTDSLTPWGEKEIAVLAEAERHRARMANAEREYFARLPRVPVGVCPFCATALIRTFDAYGFDGFWWRPDASPIEPPACAHFILLSGAVSFGQERALAPFFEVRPGPEVPFIIPSLLRHESAVAVIGRISMANGCIAYPISYFSQKRRPSWKRTAPWPRSLHVYMTPGREHQWRIPHEPWDFNLAPWVESNHLRWCPPGSGNIDLNEEGVPCPYVDLPGRREPLAVYESLTSTPYRFIPATAFGV